MNEPLKAVVVDSEAAREIVRIVLGVMTQPDEPMTVDGVLASINFSNQLIDAYLTDPPYLTELLSEYLSESDWTYESLIEKLGELIDSATRYIQYDICSVKETIIGDELGMVILMI